MSRAAAVTRFLAQLEHATSMRDGHEEVYYDHTRSRRAAYQSGTQRVVDAWGRAAGEHEDASAQHAEVVNLLQSGRLSEAEAALRKADRQSSRAERATERAEQTVRAERDRLAKAAEREAARAIRRAEREAARAAKRSEARRIVRRYRTGSGIAIWRRAAGGAS